MTLNYLMLLSYIYTQMESSMWWFAAEEEFFREERHTTNEGHTYKIKINTANETILACKNANVFLKIFPGAPRAPYWSGLWHPSPELQCFATPVLH